MTAIPELNLYVLTGQITSQESLGSPNGTGRNKPLFIDRDNRGAGRAASLAEAWLSGRPFAVMLKPEILALDIDAAGIGLLPEVRDLLRGHSHVEFASGGTERPNRHFFIHTPEPDVQAQIVRRIEQLLGGQALRRNQPIRPPGAPHRVHQNRSTPVSERQFWDFFVLVVPRPDEILARLAPSTEELLNISAANRSDHDHKVVWRLVLEGLTDGEIVRLALEGTGPFSEKAREMPNPRDRLYYLLRSLKKIRPKAALPDQVLRSRDDVDAFLSDCFDAVQVIHPTEVGGLTGRRIFAAVISLLQEQHTLERPIAIRTLAARAQVANATAVKKLEILVSGGWLIKEPATERRKATKYKLQTFKISTYLQAPGGCVTRYVPIQAGTDASVFRWGFLNESGRAVWNALRLDVPMSPSQIAEATSIPPSTVQKAVGKLVQEGLVTRPRRGQYLRNPDHDLDLLAQQMGADLRAKAQLAVHQWQREGFGWYQLRRLSQRWGWQLLSEWHPVDSYRLRRWSDGAVVTINELTERLSRDDPLSGSSESVFF